MNFSLAWSWQLLLTTNVWIQKKFSVHTFFPLQEWIKSPLLMSNLNLLSAASHPELWSVSFVPSVGLQPPFSGFTQRVPSSIRIPVSMKQRIDMKFRIPQSHIQYPKDCQNTVETWVLLLKCHSLTATKYFGF